MNSAKILEFKKQAGDFLVQLPHHLLEKSPLKYAVVHSAVCLNPMYMKDPAKKSSCESQMNIAEKLHDFHYLTQSNQQKKLAGET